MIDHKWRSTRKCRTSWLWKVKARYKQNQLLWHCPRNLEHGLWNTQNLLAHHVDVMANTKLTNADVICFTETHLLPNSIWSLTSGVTEKEYNILQSDRETMNEGGVAICTRKNIKQKKITNSNTRICYCAQQEISTQIICAYRRPQKGLTDFVNKLETILTWVNRCCLVVRLQCKFTWLFWKKKTPVEKPYG